VTLFLATGEKRKTQLLLPLLRDDKMSAGACPVFLNGSGQLPGTLLAGAAMKAWLSRGEASDRFRARRHDPEKWYPVFGKDHASK
jgi:hypothetical protein